MMETFALRPATVADLALMIDHRRRMLIDMGAPDGTGMAAMAERFGPWATAEMAGGRYFAWFMEGAAGEVAAGAAVWMKPQQPGVRSAHGDVPYVLNVFCEPAFRRRGLARGLLEHIVAWARSRGYPVVELHASDEGRPLYASMGFLATNEMRLTLEAPAV
ncbi:MAG: GNAT family N-acetyltransferase [Dehalococcoidia bacterium]